MRERLNLSFDSVSLDSSSRPGLEDDIDFYSGGSGAAVAGSRSPPPLQNGVERREQSVSAAGSSSVYSEALTPVTNKVFFKWVFSFTLPLSVGFLQIGTSTPLRRKTLVNPLTTMG